jgi:hypothetical protein
MSKKQIKWKNVREDSGDYYDPKQEDALDGEEEMDKTYVKDDYERRKLFGVIANSSVNNRECRK